MYEIESSWGAAVGFLVAVIAVIGTQFLNWEWGSGQALPAIIGVVAAGIAIFLGARYVV